MLKMECVILHIIVSVTAYSLPSETSRQTASCEVPRIPSRSHHTGFDMYTLKMALTITFS